jgi:iron complex outermembrane recepter protein
VTRIKLLWSAAGILLLSTVADARGLWQTPVAISIEEQPMEGALQVLATQTGMQLIFPSPPAPGATAPSLSGTYTPEAAFALLLRGSSLKYGLVNDHTVFIRGGAESTANADSGGGDDSQLDQVVVSAQKRSEKLIDVPTSISAISGERLENLQVNSLTDLANYVPGMSVQNAGAPGFEQIVIRGINSSNYNFGSGPTVGTYIDDLPVGSSTKVARGGETGADINPYDIDRIEVLRGPQGTLYGANTLGGLVKYSLRRPDPSRFDARIGGDSEDTDGSGRPSWGIRGAVNVPIVMDQLALRVSGIYKDNAGYIDNVRLGIDDANRSKQKGGMATLLWQASDKLQIRASVLAEDFDADDLTAITANTTTMKPVYGPLKEGAYFLEPFFQTLRNYSLSVDWSLGFATLTSSSGWSQIRTGVNYDLHDYGAFLAFVDPTKADSIALYLQRDHLSKFVEEARLTSSENHPVQWILGAYYTKERGGETESIPTFTPTYQPLGDSFNILKIADDSEYKEVAGFGDLTFKFNDRFDVGGGARYSSHTLDTCVLQPSGGIFAPPPAPCQDLPSTHVTTWMANARFHLGQDTMLYTRAATGYRPGSGCPTCGIPSLGVPGVVKPDRTTNYEIGLKGESGNRRVQFDVAAFYINWTDIQLAEVSPQGFGYGDNAGKAVSKGVESTVTYQLTRGIRLNATVAYTDGHLTEDAPNAGGKNGDQLPISPAWTGSFSADYLRPINERLSLMLGTGYRYRDKMVLQFPLASGGAYPIDQQNIVDLYGGIVLRDWRIRLYGTNVLNDRSYTGSSTVRFGLMTPTQPRTIGLGVDHQF